MTGKWMSLMHMNLLSFAFATLVASSSALAYENPTPSVTVKRVDVNGAITLLKGEKLGANPWAVRSPICYAIEFTDPNLAGNPAEWKPVDESGIRVKLKGQTIQACVQNKISSFSILLSATSEHKDHYILELDSDEPVVALAPNCPKNMMDVKNELTGDVIAVGLECVETKDTSIRLKAHFGANSTPLFARIQTASVGDTGTWQALSRVDTPYTVSVGPKTGAGMGSFQLTIHPVPGAVPEASPLPVTAATPTPSPSATPAAVAAASSTKNLSYSQYEIPLEVAGGVSIRSRQAQFTDSTYNITSNQTLLQGRLFRRSTVPFHIPGFFSDVQYALFARGDFASDTTIDAAVGLLKPVPFRSAILYIGADFLYSTTMNTNFGYKKLYAPSLDVQVEAPNRLWAVRGRFSYLGSNYMKADFQAIYRPAFLHHFFVSADYGYLSFPRSATQVDYDFKESRVGFELGYRFPVSKR